MNRQIDEQLGDVRAQNDKDQRESTHSPLRKMEERQPLISQKSMDPQMYQAQFVPKRINQEKFLNTQLRKTRGLQRQRKDKIKFRMKIKGIFMFRF